MHLGQRLNSRLDDGIGLHHLRTVGSARLQRQQAGNDLQVVLDPVMHFARQPLLFGQRIAQLAAMGVDRIGHRIETGGKAGDFGAVMAGGAHPQLGPRRVRTKAIGGDQALQPRQRLDDQAMHREPGGQQRRQPHQDRQAHAEPLRQRRRGAAKRCMAFDGQQHREDPHWQHGHRQRHNHLNRQLPAPRDGDQNVHWPRLFKSLEQVEQRRRQRFGQGCRVGAPQTFGHNHVGKRAQPMVLPPPSQWPLARWHDGAVIIHSARM